MATEINPLEFKKEPPKTFDNMKLSMVFHKDSKKAKLFLKNHKVGWSLIVWNGDISDTVRSICEKNSQAVIESKNESLKLLCLYKMKYASEIPIAEI